VKRRRSAGIHEVAARLSAFLPEPSALIGALAVAAHGYVRATDDIDFLSSVAAKEVQASLGRGGITARIRRGDAFEGDIASVVYGEHAGISFEVISPPVPIDWKRTIALEVEPGFLLRVVDLDTLVGLKVRAAGPQDLIDVVHLVRLHPEIRTKAMALAEAYGVRQRFEAWLNDPRIRSPRKRRKR
jgi:hypothetical protein